jgi:hypothetical protein
MFGFRSWTETTKVSVRGIQKYVKHRCCICLLLFNFPCINIVRRKNEQQTTRDRQLALRDSNTALSGLYCGGIFLLVSGNAVVCARPTQ